MNHELPSLGYWLMDSTLLWHNTNILAHSPRQFKHELSSCKRKVQDSIIWLQKGCQDHQWPIQSMVSIVCLIVPKSKILPALFEEWEFESQIKSLTNRNYLSIWLWYLHLISPPLGPSEMVSTQKTTAWQTLWSLTGPFEGQLLEWC